MSHEAHHGHHITPVSTLVKVIAALAILTILTVAVSRVDLGPLHVPMALFIAGVKAMLVVTFFMALKWDNRVNALVLTIGVIFVVVFTVFTLFDTAFRGDLSNVDAMTIADEQRAEARLTGQPLPGAHGTPEGEAAAAPAGEAEEGEAPAEIDVTALLQQYMCTSCHAVDNPNPMVGPSLYTVGNRLSADEIRQSILEPDAVTAEGFPAGVMAGTLNGIGFFDKITPAEVDALVAYLADQKH